MSLNLIPTGIGSVADPDSSFFGGSGTVAVKVDILDAGGAVWVADAPVVEGSISVDYSRAERRTISVTFANSDGSFSSDPDGFWYDKVLKVYRGVKDDSGSTQMYSVGTFYIDSISENNFPNSVSVNGRDATKKMILAKFSEATAYAAGQSIENIVGAIATNSGITATSFEQTGVVLASQVLWESGSPRWDAISSLANSYNQEVFFDRFGVLTMRKYVDPTTAPSQFTFYTGSDGNLASFSKSTNDSNIYNHILVKGGNTDTIPVWAQAENNEPSSPTNISKIGRRTYNYDSKLVLTSTQAQDLADSMLRIMALESYEINLESLVAPWLDVGVAITFNDPDPTLNSPTKFLLTSLNIPLTPGATMNATAKRVTLVKAS